MVGVKFPFVGFRKDLEQSSRWEGVQGRPEPGRGQGTKMLGRPWGPLGALGAGTDLGGVLTVGSSAQEEEVVGWGCGGALPLGCLQDTCWHTLRVAPMRPACPTCC